MRKLYKVNWKEVLPLYEANTKLKAVMWEWGILDIQHYFNYARFHNEELNISWITTGHDASEVKNVSFELEYEKDIQDENDEPDALIVEGTPKDIELIQKYYNEPKETAEVKLKKEKINGTSLINIHINNTKQYDLVLTIDIKSAAQLKELTPEKVVMEIPFATCIYEVMEKLEIKNWKITGIARRI